MNKKSFQKFLAWVALLVWMGVIFYFSHQSGDASMQLSDGILDSFKSLFQNFLDYHTLSYIVRKIAHFTEYFILGLLIYHLVKQYRVISKTEIIWMILFCVIYAMSDEFHQVFIGGRSPKVFDVIIDSLGTKDFARLKIGIAHDKSIDTKDYVLGSFSKKELQTLEENYSVYQKIILSFLTDGIEKTMNLFNSK